MCSYACAYASTCTSVHAHRAARVVALNMREAGVFFAVEIEKVCTAVFLQHAERLTCTASVHLNN